MNEGVINNFCVFNAGDDLELLMAHDLGEQNSNIHKLAWEAFKEAANKALKLKLYAAG
jgi:fructose 1,6-bisphosphate aldolase/phosphatase